MADGAGEVTIDSIFEEAVAGSGAKRPNDLIALALHSSLLSEGYKCLATNEEGFQSKDVQNEPIATSTEPSLPSGWNESSDSYVLQYGDGRSDTKTLIKILPLGDLLLINAVSSDKMADVHTINLPVAAYVRESATKPDEPVSVTGLRNVIKLFSVLHRDVVEKLKRIKDKDEKTSTDKTSSKEKTSQSSLLEDDRRQRYEPPFIGGGDRNPFEVGAGDLSPFGGPGGGMFMDPFRGSGGSLAPRLPQPGFHPPGARYDPVSPFGPQFHPGRGPYRGGGRGQGMYGPDPDHLPPPGYDDMFS